MPQEDLRFEIHFLILYLLSLHLVAQEYGVFPLASSDEENDLRGHHHRSRLVQLP